MGADTSMLKYPKGELRVETKRKKRLSDAQAEAECRAEVIRRWGHKCAVPGCREHGFDLHHIVYRSRSRALKFAPENRCWLCQTHHQLLHRGKITILPRTPDGELIVQGERRYLAFRL